MTWLRHFSRRSGHPGDDLSAYVDGALGSDATRSVEAHLATCADCAALLSEIQSLRSVLRGLSAPEPRRSFFLSAGQVQAVTRQRQVSLRWSRAYTGLRVSTACALVLLVASVGAQVLSLGISGAPLAQRTVSERSAAESMETANDAAATTSGAAPADRAQSASAPVAQPPAPTAGAGNALQPSSAPSSPFTAPSVAPATGSNSNVPPVPAPTQVASSEVDQSGGAFAIVVDGPEAPQAPSSLRPLHLVVLGLGTLTLALAVGSFYVGRRLRSLH